MSKFLSAAGAVIAASVMSFGETITLQQGSSGYDGCTDSYIESSMSHGGYIGSTANHGNEDRIAVAEIVYS